MDHLCNITASPLYSILFRIKKFRQDVQLIIRLLDIRIRILVLNVQRKVQNFVKNPDKGKGGGTVYMYIKHSYYCQLSFF